MKQKVLFDWKKNIWTILVLFLFFTNPFIAQVTIFTDNCESTTGWTLGASAGSKWAISSACVPYAGSNSLEINTIANACDYDKTVVYTIDAIKNVNTVGYNTLSLSFYWKCNGEQAFFHSGHRDHGRIIYSTTGPGGPWTIIGSGGCSNNTGFYHASNVWNLQTISLPAACNNNANVYIGFRYITTNTSGGTSPGFLVDNVNVIGFPPPCTAPSTQASSFGTNSISCTSLNYTFTRGNGDNVMVIARAGAAPTDPTNGSSYTANSTYGSGTAVGGGYCIYNGAAAGAGNPTGNISVSGLTSGTYYFAVYEYNNTGVCYNLTELTGSATISVGGLDAYTAAQSAQAFSSISGTGTAVTSWRTPNVDWFGGTPTLSNAISLPAGFVFPYDGGYPSAFLISTNGFITFNTATKAKGDDLWESFACGGSTINEPYTLDNTNFTNSSTKEGSLSAIAPYYQDLYYNNSINTTCYYQASGSSPNRIFTIEWKNLANKWPSCNSGSPSYGSLNFQILLYETSGNIEFRYGTMSSTTQGTCDVGGPEEVSFTCGLNSSTMSASPGLNQLFTQQTVNTGTFNNTPANNLSTIPTSNTKIFFTRTDPGAATSAPTCGGPSYYPANGSTNQCLNSTLSWTKGDQNPTGYDIYFGTSFANVSTCNAAVKVATNQGGIYYDPGALVTNTTYYWKIIPLNGFGAMPCGNATTYSFTTGAGNVPPTSLSSSAGNFICTGTASTISNVGGSTSEGSNFIWEDGACKGFWYVISTFQCSGTNDGGYTYNSPGTYYTDVYVAGCNSTTACTEIAIVVADQINPGTMDETGQTICSGGDPGQVCFTADPTGGMGSYDWQWYYKDGNNAAPTGTNPAGWTSIPGASGTLNVINEAFDNAPTAPTGWTFTSIIGNTSCFGNVSPGAEFDATSDQILTTTYGTAATKLEFFVAAKNASFSNPGSLRVEGWNGATWTTIDNFTVSANWLVACNSTTKTYNLSLASNYIRFRFTFTRTNGPIVIDDVLIRLGSTICYNPPSGLSVTRTYACMVDPTGVPDCSPYTWCGERYVVTIEPAPAPTANPQSSCSGTSAITMTGATAGGNITSASWSGGTGTWNNNGTATNPADDYFTPSSAYGSFTATLTVNSVCGGYPPATTTAVITWADGAAAYRTWTGATSNSWFTSTNWCSQSVPVSTTDVLIPANMPNAPTIAAAGAVCKDITINGSAAVNISGAFGLDVYGSWIKNGSFNAGASGTVSFTGTTNQSIGGSSSNTFQNLTINNTGTSGNDIVTLSQPATVNGALTLTDGYLTTTTTNVLTLSSSATATAGSANSFVNGPLIKQGNTAFVFPIGKNGKWARLRMSAPTASSDFRGEYFNSGYSSLTPLSGLENVSSLEYWQLDRLAGTGNANVRLYWEDATWSQISDCSANGDLVVAHWSSGTWNDMGSPTVIAGCTGGTAPSTGWIQSSSVTTFSPFTFGTRGGANPLPVELVYFSSLCKDEIAYINWTTASETNNDFFTLERSSDGLSFSIVSTIHGSGNSAATSNYEYIDLLDNPSKESIIYYRLKQTDFDGKFKYSDVIATKCLGPLFELVTIMPNPTRSHFTVFYNSPDNRETVLFEVRDMLGRIIQSSESSAKTGGNTMNIDISNTEAGVYYVIIKNNNASFVEKIIKN